MSDMEWGVREFWRKRAIDCVSIKEDIKVSARSGDEVLEEQVAKAVNWETSDLDSHLACL